MKQRLYEFFDKKCLRQKCAGCGRSFQSKELINCFKERKCRDCLSVKRISSINAVIIPKFMMREQGFDRDCRVVLVSQKNGVLVKKYVETKK